MIKTIVGGIAIGIANIIPGVSGGTMMVVLGIFNKVMDSISDLVGSDNKKRISAIMFLMQVLVGAAIGLVGFAKVIEWLFNNYSTQTMYWFIGMIVLSIPILIKSEMNGNKIKPIPLLVGMAIIFALQMLNPGKNDVVINPSFPAITLGLCLQMILIGFVSGGSMIMPGVSGSMILLILGQYYLFKSYVANVTSFSLDILIPLCFIAIGILLGIIVCAKACGYFLKHNHTATISFILGLVVASSLVLIPLGVNYDIMTIVSSIGAFIVGGIIVLGIEKLA